VKSGTKKAEAIFDVFIYMIETLKGKELQTFYKVIPDLTVEQLNDWYKRVQLFQNYHKNIKY
jgi:hypothetical protein